MKYFSVLFAFILFSPISSVAQSQYEADVASQDAIISALYEVISGDKGVKRDWERFEYLFTPEARLIPSGKNQAGKFGYRIITPKEYGENNGPWLEENGFFEKETHRKMETYGSLCHIWSTYDSYHASTDTTPFTRGINSIQLMHDGERWWIMQIYWLGETEETPLPAAYLPK